MKLDELSSLYVLMCSCVCEKEYISFHAFSFELHVRTFDRSEKK